MNNCLNCGASTKNPKYCSLSCGAKAQTRVRASRTVECLYCGKSVETMGSPNKKFCNRSCSASFNNSKAPKRGEALVIKCLECEKEILASKNHLYCSNSCYQKTKRQERVRLWLEKGSPGNGVSFPTGHFVREHVREEQNGLCSICSAEPIHNGMELNFVLDHISGDSSDNSRNNLRLICPNCDSQLPTFKSRNIGNGRHSRKQRYADGKSF